MRETLITLSELSALLQVHKITIGRWIKAGKIPAPTRIERSYFWTNAEITEWLFNNKSTTTRRSNNGRPNS